MFSKYLIFGFVIYELSKPLNYRGFSHAGMRKRGNRKRQDLKMFFLASPIAA